MPTSYLIEGHVPEQGFNWDFEAYIVFPKQWVGKAFQAGETCIEKDVEGFLGYVTNLT